MIFDYLNVFIIAVCIIISLVRGFIKELCAFMFLFLSVFLTANHYDFFAVNYNKYLASKATQNALSTVSVFVILNLIFIIANNLLMYILLPIRLGVMDRVAGVLIGAIRGVLISYILFFAINLYCCSVYHNNESQSKIEAVEVLPDWIINSYSYRIIFSAIENVINVYIPESVMLKIKEIYKGMVEQEKSGDFK